jgi:hypothetical protein
MFLTKSKHLADVDLAVKVVGPTLALVGTFFYVALDMRKARWKREVDTYVGHQIRRGLLALVPKDLNVTEIEIQELGKSEVFKDLTGVFWEAIDKSPVLKSHKEHFYSNGIVYTTAIDVYLICGFAAFSYAVAFSVFRDVNQAYTAGLLIVVALASRLLAIPRARKRHMKLSAEQLDLLRREEGAFVQDRFREIVMGWRRARALP